MAGLLSWEDLKIEYSEEELAKPIIPIHDNSDSNKDSGDSSQEKGGSGSGSPVPPWIIEERVRFSNWRYVPEKEILINVKVQKQVELAKLNSAYIILNFIQSLSLKPELELDNFIIELEKVCFSKYNKSLTEIIEDHLDRAILWNKQKEDEILRYIKNKKRLSEISSEIKAADNNLVNNNSRRMKNE